MLGTNDFAIGTDQATFQTYMVNLVTTLHADFPTAPIGLLKPPQLSGVDMTPAWTTVDNLLSTYNYCFNAGDLSSIAPTTVAPGDGTHLGLNPSFTSEVSSAATVITNALVAAGY